MDINKRWLAAGVFLLLLAFAAGVKYESFKIDQKQPDKELVQTEKTAKAGSPELEKDTIMVYVVGEVNNPGVYRLQEGDRVFQAVEMAGGSLETADLEQIDMARKLADEDTVEIMAVGEAPDPATVSNSGTGRNTGSRRVSSGQTGGLININTASATELDSLDGIGPTLAQRIIDYRNANGPFASIEDINNVSGIGDKKYEAIKNSITVR